MKIEVRGVPAPQGSKRAFRNKSTGRIQMTENSARVAPWREAVRAEVQRACKAAGATPMAGAVHVTLTFFLTRPAAHFGSGRNHAVVRPGAPRYPTGKKDDLDKLTRSTLDGLVDGGGIGDDGQVVLLTAGKEYGTPGCVIIVEVL